jgi:adenylate cyclase
MAGGACEPLPLRPLDPEAIDELLSDLLGRDASVAALPDLIRRRTTGNPFFVEELVRSLVEAGSLTGEPGAYRMVQPIGSLETPATIHAVLGARIDRLRERDKQVLQTAAVIGREFSEPVLAGVMELPETELAAALSVLERGEFIAQEALYPVAEYAFRHPLTQEVAYGSQLSERRGRIHAAVARELESASPERADEQASLLAHHWESAGEGLEASRCHRRAALWVEPRDLDGALRHWRRVRELLSESGESAEALALAIETRGQILRIGGLQGIPKEEAENLLAEGRQLVERSGDESQLAELLMDYALACIFSGDFEEGLECYLEVERATEAAATPGFRALLRVLTAHALSTLGRFEEVLARVDGVIAELERDPERRAGAIDELGPNAVALYFFRANALRFLGRLDEAEADVARVLEADASRASPQWVGLAHGEAAAIALMRGDLSLGRSEAQRALEIGERIGYLNARLSGLIWATSACARSSGTRQPAISRPHGRRRSARATSPTRPRLPASSAGSTPGPSGPSRRRRRPRTQSR